jgi:hypothetical protein
MPVVAAAEAVGVVSHAAGRLPVAVSRPVGHHGLPDRFHIDLLARTLYVRDLTDLLHGQLNGPSIVVTGPTNGTICVKSAGKSGRRPVKTGRNTWTRRGKTGRILSRMNGYHLCRFGPVQ